MPSSRHVIFPDMPAASYLSCPEQAIPVKERSWVGLAPGRNIGMSCNRIDWFALANKTDQIVKDRILNCFKRKIIAAFKFDANRKIVTMRPAIPRRLSGMPCPMSARNELDQFTITANQKMRRHANSGNRLKIGVRARIKLVCEQTDDTVSSKPRGRKTDRMDDDQRNRRIRRAIVKIRRNDTPRARQGRLKLQRLVSCLQLQAVQCDNAGSETILQAALRQQSG